MTAQEYLVRAYHCKSLIRTKKEQLLVLKDLVSRITVSPDEEHVSGTNNVHSMESMIASITDLENEIRADENMFAKYEFENIALINKLPGYKERRILILRYIQYKDWATIASKMNLSKRRLQTIHGQALDCITEILRRDKTVPSIEDRPRKNTGVRFVSEVF